MQIKKNGSRTNTQIPPATDSLAPTIVPPSNGDVNQDILGSSSNSECAEEDSLKPLISDVLVKTETKVEAENAKKPSPSKACNNMAVEPSESAHMDNLVNGETVLNGTHVMKPNPDDQMNSVLQTEMKNNTATTSEMEESGKDPSKSTSEKLITNDILQEEQQLQQNSIEAEEKLQNEQEEYWKNMNEMCRKERYQRLQVLLEKCNAYTQYLLKRMKKQEEEDARNKKLMSQIKARQDWRREEKIKLTKQSNGTLTAENGDPSSTNSILSTKKRALPDSIESPNCKKSKLSDDTKVCSGTETDGRVNGDVDLPEQISEDFEDPSLDESTNIYDRKINGEQVPISQPLLISGGVLRPYQIDGYNWLKMLYENGVNGILADEMGLGKTIQCIALVAHLASMGVKGPFLVVGPLSTVPNWVAEFGRFTPRLPVILYHGDQNKRCILRKKMLKVKKLEEKVFVLPVVITSYEIVMNDRKLLSHIKWKYLIVDEGQRIKNTHCRLIKELRAYNTTHRLLLTGTPLQNSLSELWSLLNFLLPELFDDLRSFESWFDIESISQQNSAEEIMANEQKDHILSMLHQILTPFMLRRLKSDVELLIPPKKEILVFCPLTKLQQTFYKATLDNTIEGLLDKKPEVKVKLNEKGRPVRQSRKTQLSYKHMLGGSTTEKTTWSDRDEKQLMTWMNNVIDSNTKREQERASKSSPASNSRVNLKMNNIMMMLRKICNHPYLVEHPLDPKTGELLLHNDLIKHSGKVGMLDQMLPELKKNGHKVLIFSQFVQVLNILEDYCYLKNYAYSRLDGNYGFEQRQQEIDSFNKDPDTFLFLLSTRAGGLGINLVAADTVIIFDSDWNPQCDLQAQDRCHRIGQVKPVVVYRLVTRNTIDQQIVERATAKRKLEKMIIHKGKFKCGIKNFTTSLTSMSPQELRELLQSSDHEEIYEGGNRSSIISRSDLEKMLDRSDLMDKLQETKKGHKKKASKMKTCQEIEGVFRVIEADEDPTKLSNITDMKEDDSVSKSSTN